MSSGSHVTMLWRDTRTNLLDSSPETDSVKHKFHSKPKDLRDVPYLSRAEL